VSVQRSSCAAQIEGNAPVVYFVLKTIVSALVIVGIAEIAKRSTVASALIASLPLTSLLAFVWLYRDTHDAARIASLSVDIFWLVIPSLALFLTLPLFIRLGWGFWLSLLAAIGVTAACYLALFWLLRRMQIIA
jgi:hypothetical protein